MAFFMLFFVNNVFKQDVGGNRTLVAKTETVAEVAVESIDSLAQIQATDLDEEIVTGTIEDMPLSEHGGDEALNDNSNAILLWIFVSILLVTAVLLLYFLIKRNKKNQQSRLEIEAIERKYLNTIDQLEKSIEDKIHAEDDMGKELKFRQGEMVTMAMSIIHKNEFLNNLKNEVVKIKSRVNEHEARRELNKLSLMITQDLSIDRDREKFQMHINEQNSNFIHQLSQSFPTMTDNEKRLASLLRLNLSSKEIASILNISPKSVEMNRYRLRKKLKVSPKVNLSDFIREL
jgi:DNA-binding CsgD family transcriptional regulator